MREILFRAYSKSNNKWVYGYYVKKNNVHIIKEKNGSLTYIIDNPETIGQYIGLDDKNGKRIFEGDKINLIDQNKDKNSGVYEIIFKSCCFWAKQRDNDVILQICSTYVIEIVGNIHEKEALNEN
jgi:uncharacterized phage protein (TIGR01671 family)